MLQYPAHVATQAQKVPDSLEDVPQDVQEYFSQVLGGIIESCTVAGTLDLLVGVLNQKADKAATEWELINLSTAIHKIEGRIEIAANMAADYKL